MKVIESVSLFGHITPEQTETVTKYLSAKKINVNAFTRFDGCLLPVTHPREAVLKLHELTGIAKKYIYLAYTDVE